MRPHVNKRFPTVVCPHCHNMGFLDCAKPISPDWCAVCAKDYGHDIKITWLSKKTITTRFREKLADEATRGRWVSIPSMQQHCKRCHRAQYVEFNVSDDLWQRAVSPKFCDVALCLECFVLEATERGVKLSGDDMLHVYVVQPQTPLRL